MHIVGKDLLRCSASCVLFTTLSFCLSSDQWKKKQKRAAKILSAVWETFLLENNCSFNFHKFKYKFTLVSSFVETKSKSGKEKYMFFIYGESGSTAKECQIQ